ncbi:MAG: glycosyltransferase [Planctomycetota bacterium]|jgi:glycosyltransferase involved in cell wall biosynthesis
MKTSLIICTYNAPRFLDFVFCGLSRQTRMPDEILIADDGSTDETKEVVESWGKKLATEVHHVWQVDRGFRKCRISNEAVRRSTGEYLIFIDGDAIPHARFIEDHLLAADGRHVLCGRRVKLGPKITENLDRDEVMAGGLEKMFGPVLWSTLGRDTTRFGLSVRLGPRVAKFMHPRARRLMGVNFSVSREAFYAVNGYDEVEGVRARVDRDLELRLLRWGAPLYPLLNRAIVYHMYHPERGLDPASRAWHAEQEASTRTRCELGLDTAFDANV